MHPFIVQIEKYKFILDVYRAAVHKRQGGQDYRFELKQLSDLLPKCIFTAFPFFGATAPGTDSITILNNPAISESTALEQYYRGMEFYNFLHDSFQKYLKAQLDQD